MNKSLITKFNTIYYDSYPKRLEELGRIPSEDIVVRIIPMRPIINYDFETQEDFYDAYFYYLSDYLNVEVIDAYNYYIELYDLFCEIMADDLLEFNEEEICELYVMKTIYNFYSGFKFEKDVSALISEIPYRSLKQINELDTEYKIDLEVVGVDDDIYGLQLKTMSYLNVNNKTKGYHKSRMKKYIEDYEATDVFYVLHNHNVQPMKLRNNNTYLIPFNSIQCYELKDFIVGTYEELEIELNNL